jgi:hypothetical protein
MCPDDWSHVSESGKELVKLMLTMDATRECNNSMRHKPGAWTVADEICVMSSCRSCCTAAQQ